MISIQKYFLNHRLKNKNIRLKIYFNLDGINFPIYFIMENNNFNERISGSCNYNKNTKLPKSIDIIIPYKNNHEKFKNFIHENFILELKEVINHELSHLFDKESINDDYLNPLESEIKTFTENLFYQLQFSEIKAVLQESIPRVKNGEDIIDILSNRIKSIFYPKYENLKSSLVKLYFYVFISTTYNNINLKNTYWKYFSNNKNIKKYIINKNNINLINQTLLFISRNFISLRFKNYDKIDIILSELKFYDEYIKNHGDIMDIISLIKFNIKFISQLN